MAGDYRGLAGALVSAFRRSDSHVLRAYVLSSVVVGVLVALFLLLGLVYWLGTPAPLGQRALLGVVALFLLVPMFAPVLVAARRHRFGVGDRRADSVLGLAGFGFLLSVYLAGLVSDPNPHEVSGALAPVLAAIDAVPRRYWAVPPLLSVATIWLAVRFTRPGAESEGAPVATGTDEPAEDSAGRNSDDGRAEG